jgi:hypothetical protein
MAAEAGYTPGDWVAVVGPTAFLLAELDPADSPILARCWPLIRDNAPADEVLDAIVADGFRGLPGFALVRLNGSTARVVVRGSAVVRTVGDAIHELRAAVGTTWIDELVSEPLRQVELAADAGVAIGYSLPVSAGTTMASAIRITLGPTLAAADELRSVHNGHHVAPEPTAAPTAAGTETPSYDHLFGDTRLLRPARSTPDVPPAVEPTTGTNTCPAEPLVTEPVTATAPEIPAGIIDAVPWASPEPQSSTIKRPTVPGPTPIDQAVAKTIDRSRLLADAAADRLGGETVLAAYCQAGHPNPSNLAACRRCHAPVPEQQPRQVVRPQLGRLRLSTGDVVPLDRGVLLGRAPDVVELDPSDRPHIVRLASASGDISRAHLQVTLAGWQVLVTDLNSVNGSTVTAPGTQPVRLQPAEPVAIEPGTVISLAGDIDITYEVAQ